ncbi:MAG: DUF3795 domain-containing protein [Anaerolineae bacterium]|nr:DUF3795 domain-containing protein [Anaerolineae bacterium]
MEQMIAYCGLVCTDCPSLLATQANDIEALKKVAQMAMTDWGMQNVTWEMVRCTGCKGDGVRIGYCAECKVRACASEKGVDTCGHCAKFESCETIQGFIANIPEAKELLTQIHQSLN